MVFFNSEKEKGTAEAPQSSASDLQTRRSSTTATPPNDSLLVDPEANGFAPFKNELPRELESDREQQEEAVTEPPPRNITGWKWGVVVLAILSSTFLFALDNTIVADVQPTIILEFKDVSKLTWVSVSFLMGAASTNLIWGKIFGHFNAKWMYIFSIALFEVGSAVCGSAPGMNALIIGRVICGVGGSGMYVGVMTLLAMTTSIHERPMYVGGIGLTWGLGTILGPIIGGAFTDSSAGWRYAFYINLFIGALFAPVYIFMLPNKDPRPGVSLKDRARELDYVGAILNCGAFVSGVMAISFGGVTYPWQSGKIIGLFICSGVLFILLGLQQVYAVFTTPARRIVSIEFFSSRTILILFAITAAGGSAIFIPVYMIPLFFQFSRSDAALEAGVRLLPFIFLMIFAVVSNGAILSMYGYYMPWYTAGGALVVTGGALMYTVDVSTSVARVYGYSAIIGFGVGLFIQASFSVAQAVVAPELVASVVGFISCAQTTGLTIALAIASCIFLNKSQSKIESILPGTPLAEIQQAISGAGSEFVDSLAPDLREKILAAIVTSMSTTYILVITAGAVVLILSAFMKRERLFIKAGVAA